MSKIIEILLVSFFILLLPANVIFWTFMAYAGPWWWSDFGWITMPDTAYIIHWPSHLMLWLCFYLWYFTLEVISED